MPLPCTTSGASNAALSSSDDDRRRRLADEWGSWLAPLSWDHALTLTTARHASVPMLKTGFEKFARNLERTTQGRVLYFYAVEGREAGNRPHIHALLSGTGHLRAADVARHWRLGFARVRPYDPKAAYYVVKTFGRTAWDVYDSSKLLPKPRLEPQDNTMRKRRLGSNDPHDAVPHLTTVQKANMFDLLCERATAVRLNYGRGRLTVEAEPRHIADVLCRVLGVLEAPAGVRREAA